MLGYLVDSDVIIDHLTSKSATEYLKKHNPLFISVITISEVLSGINHASENYEITKQLLDTFTSTNVTVDVAILAAKIRNKCNVKLPDCLIAASAIKFNLILISRNETDFDKIKKVSKLQINIPDYTFS